MSSPTISQIKKHIQAQIDREINNGGRLNVCSWQNKEGVVITVNDAIKIIKLLEKKSKKL
jgi:hypothetical protein